MKRALVFASLSVLTVLLGCGDSGGQKTAPAASGSAKKPAASAAGSAKAASGPKPIDRKNLAVFEQLPKESKSDKNPATPAKVALGRQLYFDTRLSKNHDVSCNTCHNLETYGVDNKPVSEGHGKQKGTRNSPTVYGAALHTVQFWDGRAADVEEQATGPIVNPVEMAADEKRVVETLTSIPEYKKAFEESFPDEKEPVTLVNVGKAIGAFERTLLVSGKWDKYLAGDDAALSQDEKNGLSVFMDSGCTSCHGGAMVGGNMLMKLGAVKPWTDEKDKGKFEVTKDEKDKMFFKVPTLRNVAKTAPYFHDGSVSDLGEAVKKMAFHQNGLEISADEIKAVVAFLGALTVEIPAEMTKAPELPKSTPKTPKPDPAVASAAGEEKKGG